MSPIVALDLETTWFDPKNDAIIEIALVKFDENGVLEEWSSLVNPGMPISEEVSNITGIFQSDVEKAPYFSELREKIVSFIGDCPLLWHNVDFDKNFLEEYNIRFEDKVFLDTFKLAQVFFHNEKSLNLGSLAESFGFAFTGQHRALADTQATVLLYRKCMEHAKSLSEDEKDAFSFAATISPSHSTLRYFYTEVFQKDAGATLAEIQDMIISKQKDEEELIFLKKEEIEIKASEILDSVSQRDGIELEKRLEQRKMLNLSEEALFQQELVLIEAPTGIGKTFAYCVPSILFSIKTGNQVFISTNTKTLQDQVFEKDIPSLRKLFSHFELDSFSVLKLKGRKNYIGLLPFFEYLEGVRFDELEAVFIGKILFWLLKTRTGELDELNFYTGEFALLDKINASDFRILVSENPYRKEEFLYQARQNAKSANLVIINHALLLGEAENEQGAWILPEMKYVVIDEAHNLEAVATEAFRVGTSLSSIEQSLLAIDIIIKKERKVKLGEAFIFPDFKNFSESIVLNFWMVMDFIGRYYDEISTSTYQWRNEQLLIDKNFFSMEGIDGITRILDTLSGRIQEFVSFLYKAPQDVYLAMEKHISRIEMDLMILQNVFAPGRNDLIKIVSKSANGDFLVSTTILKVGPNLQDKLWKKLDACIATSATLTVEDSFQYMENTLSLTDFKKHILASDFDYSKQALVFIPSDIGDVRDENSRREVNDFISEIIRIIGGKTLCLFTSFASIKETYLQINLGLKKEGIDLLTQGLSGWKQKMIESFKKYADRSALFGTDSFWEWVDIPGKDLEMLIIYKFPFAVPTDPIFVARSRLFRDSFQDYSLPSMIIKLKQGLGRLIRTKEDKGVIVLLDKRIHSAWGETVKSSFPHAIPIRTGNRSVFLDMIKNRREKKV